MKITDSTIKKLTAPNTGNKIYYDSEIGGFGVRVTESGQKSFILTYWIHKRQRRITIGSCAEMSADIARNGIVEKVGDKEIVKLRGAQQLRQLVRSGTDPMEERLQEQQEPSFANMLDAYLASDGYLKRRESTRRDYERMTKVLRERFKGRQLKAVTRQDFAALHLDAGNGVFSKPSQRGKPTPYAANRLLAFVSLFYSFVQREGWVQESPVEHIEKYPEDKRERYLTDVEIGRLHQALDTYTAQHRDSRHQQDAKDGANALRLLLLTGARLGEVLSATWEQFDLDAGVWVKPSAHTKTRKLQRLELGDAEWNLLRKMRPKNAAGPLFVGRNGEDAREGIRRVWDFVRHAARLKGVRLHDLRHTNASVLASLGYSLPVIGKRLGHTQSATTARYSHLTDTVSREAANAAGKLLSMPRKSA